MHEFESVEELELVLTTEANAQVAKNLANTLLECRLAACISFRNISSLYWWNSQIEQSNEVQLLIKTKKNNLRALQRKIAEIHSYEIYEFIHWTAKSDKNYGNWLNNELNSSD